MPKKIRRTADDFVREKRSGKTPPPTHNSGLPALNRSESAAVERALEALATIRKTFEFWVKIGKALKALHVKAEVLGQKKAYDLLREREGLGKEVISKSRSSRLLAIIDHLPEIQKWRDKLTDKQHFDWQSPEAVHRHFFAAADKEPTTPNIERIIKKLVAAMDGKAPAEREHVVMQLREALIETALEKAA
jgi:hypothetical protein